MRVLWRRLREDELDHELIWLVVSATGIALAACWLKLGLPWPRCFFHDLTGHPCVTCGATRAMLALIRGDFITAANLNPLAFVAMIMFAIYDCYAVVVLAFRTRRLRLSAVTIATKRVVRFALPLIALANWIYVLRRGLV